jgi:signal transduction histidine kinase
VSDTGRGIPRDSLTSIFEPFVQVKTGPADMREGVGLGLSISRELARGMGGDLRARSTVGQGSTFTLSLPSAATTEQQRAARSTPSPSG